MCEYGRRDVKKFETILTELNEEIVGLRRREKFLKRIVISISVIILVLLVWFIMECNWMT